MRSALLAFFTSTLLAGCAGPEAPRLAEDDGANGDEVLLQDFNTDGKRDAAGHPLNALVVEAEAFCKGPGWATRRSFIAENAVGTPCEGTLPRQPAGQIVNLRVRAFDIDRHSSLPVLRVTVGGGAPVTWSGRSFRRSGQWAFLPIRLETMDSDALRVETFGRGLVELDYIEVVPDHYSVALGPGSGVLADEDEVRIEVALGEKPVFSVDGTAIDLDALVAAGQAQRADTAFRRVYTVEVARLAQGHSGDLDLRASASGAAARMRVYRAAPACAYEGPTDGRRVLITGFQPFPADEAHENVSAVAVHALVPSALVGARVMRLELPVEYDGAPALVEDAIARCAPEVVISFGQGGGGLALERTAYNLKDAGSTPDNRGRFQAGLPIAEDAPTELPTGLPLEAIAARLADDPARAALGVDVAPSDDPGRYVCNDTFYTAVRAAAAHGARAGFVHLPYTTSFTDETRVEWGEIARAVVEASAAR